MAKRNLKQSALKASIFFITLKTVNNLAVFTKYSRFLILIDSLKYCQNNKGLIIYAYSILNNHLHLVFSVENNKPDNLIRDIKRHTTTKMHKLLIEENDEKLLNLFSYSAINRKNTSFRLWKRAVYPEEIFTSEFFLQKIKYVEFNPVHHNLTKNIEKYPYTSYHSHYCQHQTFLKTNDCPAIL